MYNFTVLKHLVNIPALNTDRGNSFIIVSAMKNYLVASILASLVSQVSILTDGIIVSQLVARDAMSAINLYFPIAGFISCVIMLISGGASLVAAKKLGESDVRSVSSIYSVTMTLSFAVTVILVAILYVLMPEITSLLCDNQELYQYLLDYSRVQIFNAIVISLTYVLFGFIKIDGSPRTVSGAFIISSLSNIVLDIFCIKVLDMGIAGSAVATILSSLIGLMAVVPHLRKGSRSFHYCFSVSDLKPVLKTILPVGTSITLANFVFTACILIINETVLTNLGKEGAYVLAILVQLISISNIAVTGFGQVVMSVGAVLYGDGDYEALRQLVFKCCKWICIIIGSLTLLLLLFPEAVVGVFGSKSGIQMDNNVQSLRESVLVLFPNMIILFFANVYLLSNRIRLSTIFNALSVIVLVIPILLFSNIWPQYVWISLPVCSWSLLAVMLVTSLMIRKKDFRLAPMTLLPLLPDDVSVKLSVKYNRASVVDSLRDLKLFLDICELDRDQNNAINQCCGELMNKIIETGKTKSIERRPDYAVFEIRLKEKVDRINVTFKDAGKPFNPLGKSGSADVQPEQSLLYGLCDEIEYKYNYGLNVIVMNFKKTNKPQFCKKV